MCVCVVEEFQNSCVTHKKLYYSIQRAGNCPAGLGNLVQVIHVFGISRDVNLDH